MLPWAMKAGFKRNAKWVDELKVPAKTMTAASMFPL